MDYYVKFLVEGLDKNLMKQVIDANLNNNFWKLPVDVSDREAHYPKLRHWNN